MTNPWCDCPLHIRETIMEGSFCIICNRPVLAVPGPSLEDGLPNFMEWHGMNDPKQCNQSGCENPGAYRFTWPGNDEAVVCEEHVGKLRGVAQAMGLHLQVIPLESEES